MIVQVKNITVIVKPFLVLKKWQYLFSFLSLITVSGNDGLSYFLEYKFLKGKNHSLFADVSVDPTSMCVLLEDVLYIFVEHVITDLKRYQLISVFFIP